MRDLMRKLCKVSDCCMSTIVEFGTFSIESKMFLLWFQISALMSLVLSAELQPNPGSCPLIMDPVPSIDDVKACVQSLTKRSPTEYCASNKADCELDVADCGQSKVTQKLLCVWRNCFAYCILHSDNEDKCIEACLGPNSKCDSSGIVQKMIDCHVDRAKSWTNVDESKIICPLDVKSLSKIDICIGFTKDTSLERTCQRLASVCKYADIDNCKSSIRNPWFDTRLLCAAIRCNRICYGVSSKRSEELCRKDCIGEEACKVKEGEESLLCSIEASEKFISGHKYLETSVSEPTYLDKRKLVDCSIILSRNYIDEKDSFTDCIHMMITINMDKFCKENFEVCPLFSDDCKQAKPMKLPYLDNGQKFDVDTYLGCLGHKCYEACSERWTGNISMVLSCRMSCIGDIEKCSHQTSNLERLKCHIDHAASFIKEGQKEESPGEGKEGTPGKDSRPPPTSNPGNGLESQTENHGQKPKVEVTIAILSVLLYKALGLIFNDSLL